MNKMDQTIEFKSLKIAVLTISDTRESKNDRSGDILQERIETSGHQVVARSIVIDKVDMIRTQINEWVNRGDIQVIITTGGTGFTGRDVTPEAIEPLFDKQMDGFSFLFHKVSFEKIGIVTMQSRATAGLIKQTFVFCLPGSPGACKDAWDSILKGELDSRQRPSNLVELMPRLNES